jgi:hypothetical protein
VRALAELGTYGPQRSVAIARENRPVEAVSRLSAAKKSFLAGATLTILIQTIGKQHWIWNGLREVFRSPGVFLTPYFFQRLFKDGWKIASLALTRQDKETRPVWTNSRKLPDLQR